MKDKLAYTRQEFCDNCKVFSTFEQVGSTTLVCKKCGNSISKYRIDYVSIILATISSVLVVYGVWYITGTVYYPLLFIGFMVWFLIFSIARVVFNVLLERRFQ